MITIELTDEIPEGATTVEEVDGKYNVYFKSDKQIDDGVEPTKQYARIQVKIDCEKKILEPVESNATGSMVKIRNNVTDQMNMLAAIIAGIDTTITDDEGKKIKIKVKDAEQMHLEIVTKKEGHLADKAARKDEIELATTEAEIQSIIDRAW